MRASARRVAKREDGGLLTVVGPLPGLYLLPESLVPFANSLVHLIPVALIAARQVTILDGPGRRVIHLGFVPRITPFEQVAGLGRLEVRVVNRNASYYYLVLFLENGKLYRLDPLPDSAIPGAIAQIAAATGVPVAQR